MGPRQLRLAGFSISGAAASPNEIAAQQQLEPVPTVRVIASYFGSADQRLEDAERGRKSAIGD